MNDESKQSSRSIEDNYPEYLDREYGYVYEVDDVMSQGALKRHDHLLHADEDALMEAEPDAQNDFFCWAIARAWRRLGEFDRFVSICGDLLDGGEEHPVVVYSEISRGLARALVSAARLEEATETMRAHLERWPDDIEARQLAGVIDLLAKPVDEGRLEALLEEFPADAELCFEISEDLWRFGEDAKAAEWLERARQAAEESKDHAAKVDIELLAGRLERVET